MSLNITEILSSAEMDVKKVGFTHFDVWSRGLAFRSERDVCGQPYAIDMRLDVPMFRFVKLGVESILDPMFSIGSITNIFGTEDEMNVQFDLLSRGSLCGTVTLTITRNDSND